MVGADEALMGLSYLFYFFFRAGVRFRPTISPLASKAAMVGAVEAGLRFFELQTNLDFRPTPCPLASRASMVGAGEARVAFFALLTSLRASTLMLRRI